MEEIKYKRSDYEQFIKDNYPHSYTHKKFRDNYDKILETLFENQVKSKTKIVETIKNIMK